MEGVGDHEAWLKRLRMRSWRRGMRETDLILGPFADTRLDGMDDAVLATYERLLSESDADLLSWILGRTDPPDWAGALIAGITAFARSRHQPG